MKLEPVILVDVEDEPVTIEEIKSWLRIDADYASEDSNLMLIAASSREKLEKHLNLSFAPKTWEVQFSGESIELPYGPHVMITSLLPVNVDNPEEITDYKEFGLQFKSIYLAPLNGANFFYPISGALPEIWNANYISCGTYNVKYLAGYGNENMPLPKALKHALLIQIDYDYKNQGEADEQGLSTLALSKAEIYSKNLIIS